MAGEKHRCCKRSAGSGICESMADKDTRVEDGICMADGRVIGSVETRGLCEHGGGRVLQGVETVL
jgi:hypothetical protein